MRPELTVLVISAASIGFFHTLLGPDHYLPFIMMARAGRWSRLKTTWVTLLCGMGHVGSSVLLGTVGIALGIAVTRLEVLEAVRGTLAAWFLIAFGLVYFAWGLRRAWRNRPHSHSHAHDKNGHHTHKHVHSSKHLHAHEKDGAANLTPWVLFTIFALGPCEPLIPLLMYPAAKMSFSSMVWVTVVFGGVTVATMLGIVTVSALGVTLLPVKRIERYSHALAGATVCLCGLSMQFLGL